MDSVLLCVRWCTVKLVSHRHPGAGSDPGHKLPLPVGGLSLDLLEAVQSGGEVIQQAFFLYLPLPLKGKQMWTDVTDNLPTCSILKPVLSST